MRGGRGGLRKGLGNYLSQWKSAASSSSSLPLSDKEEEEEEEEDNMTYSAEEEENNEGEYDKEEENQVKDRPKLEDGYYEIEDIRKKRIRKGQVHYLIKWSGWPESENTWEPKKNLRNCPEVIEAFEKRSSMSSRKGKHKYTPGSSSHTRGKKRKHLTTASNSSATQPSSNGPCNLNPAEGTQAEILSLQVADDLLVETGGADNSTGENQSKETNEVNPTSSLEKLPDEVNAGNFSIQKPYTGVAEKEDQREDVTQLTGAKRRKSGCVSRFKPDSEDILCPVTVTPEPLNPFSALEMLVEVADGLLSPTGHAENFMGDDQNKETNEVYPLSSQEKIPDEMNVGYFPMQTPVTGVSGMEDQTNDLNHSAGAKRRKSKRVSQFKPQSKDAPCLVTKTPEPANQSPALETFLVQTNDDQFAETGHAENSMGDQKKETNEGNPESSQGKLSDEMNNGNFLIQMPVTRVSEMGDEPNDLTQSAGVKGRNSNRVSRFKPQSKDALCLVMKTPESAHQSPTLETFSVQVNDDLLDETGHAENSMGEHQNKVTNEANTQSSQEKLPDEMSVGNFQIQMPLIVVSELEDQPINLDQLEEAKRRKSNQVSRFKPQLKDAQCLVTKTPELAYQSPALETFSVQVNDDLLAETGHAENSMDEIQNKETNEANFSHEMLSDEVNVGNILIQLSDTGVPEEEDNSKDVNKLTGTKRRKSRRVSRFKPDLEEAPCPVTITSEPAHQSLEPSEKAASDNHNQPLTIVKIVKPLRYRKSISGVMVTFSALRSDGQVVEVDNQFMKDNYHHLLIDHYEQKILWGPAE